MKRKRISRWFSGEFLEESDRAFGILDHPSGHLAFEQRPSALEIDGTRLLRRRPGAQTGQNNRLGVVNSKTKAMLTDVAWLFGAGYSIRKIACLTGLARMTVQHHIRKMGLRAGYCRCGKLGTHQGWCAYRFALSEARQAFILRWTTDRDARRTSE